MNRLLLLAAIAITMLSCNDIEITIIKSENHEEVDILQYVDLSEAGTANCYLVKSPGNYKFKAVKGNSDEVLSLATTAVVLWETFGTVQMPCIGDIISSVTYKDDYVYFSTSDLFRDGNASIAVRDSEGTILWSWHIWCSREGWIDQVYPNGAGTMMDRNLGATSATPGYVEAFGLLYQWGRKDPFLGPSYISDYKPASSTGIWPTAENSNDIDFANQNPMTFALEWRGGNVSGNGWHTSESEKGLYDPCPVGYRVPDGGKNGLWDRAYIGSELGAENCGLYWYITNEARAWYPIFGYLSYDRGGINASGYYGYNWSASADPSSTYQAYCFHYGYTVFPLSTNYDQIFPVESSHRGQGNAVRCIREGSTTAIVPPDDEQLVDLSQYTDLSDGGTANCYPVKAAGNYKFKAVKGNYSDPLSLASTANVLWETFGTEEMPNVGDVIHSVGYKDGYVYFSTSDLFRDGNASIAVRDSKGNILWSWHIWCSRDGWIDQVYPNGAGTMMDRNLGATSATPGSVGALGLLYQWGRKDPFIGSYTISSSDQAQATGLWYNVSSARSIDYAISNPTTYIYYTHDWCSDSISETTDGIYRWKNGNKTMYDPCPVGYRVPDGGENDFWDRAFGYPIIDVAQWDSTYRGVTILLNGNSNSAWYPSAGYRDYDYGKVVQSGSMGVFWTASAYKESSNSCSIVFFDTIHIYGSARYRCDGCSVRCVKE